MSEEAATAAGSSAAAPAWWGYLLAIPLCGLATLLASVVEGWVAVPNLSLIFVLPVVILAVTFGAGPAVAAALVGVLAFNFFLIEPRYTLRVDDPANVWGLGLLFVVAVVVSGVAAQSRRRAVQAESLADQSSALQALTRALVAAPNRDAIVSSTAAALARLFGAPAAVLLADGEGLAAVCSPDVELAPDDLEAARLALSAGQPTRADAYPVENATFDFWPVKTRSRLRLALGVRLLGERGGRPVETDRLVEIVGGYMAVALERDRYAGQAMEARIGLESERVKADLLAAVSHDLRTPLSTILVSLQSLQRFGDSHDDDTRRALLALAEVETARLSGLVANLLAMSRIEADAIAVKRAPSLPADLVTAALDRAHHVLHDRRIDNRVGPLSLPVMVDGPLVEAALANVLENAGKYSPPGSTVSIRAEAVEGGCAIRVLDQGPGFPRDAEPLFEKFARGVQGDGRAPGTGLGLAIARGFLQAQGGRISAGNRRDGPGGEVVLFLPEVQQVGVHS